jgi:hypothetical protein
MSLADRFHCISIPRKKADARFIRASRDVKSDKGDKAITFLLSLTLPTASPRILSVL